MMASPAPEAEVRDPIVQRALRVRVGSSATE